MENAAKPFVVDVVLAARDQEAHIGAVVRELPPRIVRSVLVVDNGSKDRTARVAEDAGAIVLRQATGGSGAAYLRAVAHMTTLPKPPDAVVFMAADGTADPRDLPALLRPLGEGLFDLALGSRALPHDGANGRTSRASSWLAVNLIHAIYGHRYTDLGPLRAIRYPALIALGLRDTGLGFFAEMQVKAVRRGLRIAEVPVGQRKPAGDAASLGDDLRTTGRTLYHILRHATAR